MTCAAHCGVEVRFSVESSEGVLGKDYYLTANGRYKHTADYIEKTLRRAGFAEITAYPLILRKENGEDVAGVLYRAV